MSLRMRTHYEITFFLAESIPRQLSARIRLEFAKQLLNVHHISLIFQEIKRLAMQKKILKMFTYSTTTSPTQTWRKSGRKTGAPLM